MVWINADGLRVKFGIEETTPARVVEYTTDGPQRLVEVLVDADFLPDESVTAGIVFDEYVFPSNANIEEISVGPESETFTSAGSATLAVSLVDKDGTSNSVALETGFSIAELNAQHSEKLDVQLTAQKYLRLVVGTDAFDTGKGTIRIKYSIPKVETDTLVWSKP